MESDQSVGPLEKINVIERPESCCRVCSNIVRVSCRILGWGEGGITATRELLLKLYSL